MIDTRYFERHMPPMVLHQQWDGWSLEHLQTWYEPVHDMAEEVP